MKRNLVLNFVMVACALLCLSLSPQERATLSQARQSLLDAKSKAQQEQAIHEQLQKQANDLAGLADNQGEQIQTLSGQIEVAHKNEQALGDWKKANEPVIRQVTRLWGLGAIWFGIKLLFRHLLILAAVAAALGVGVFVLSIFFPVIGVAASAIWSLLKRLGGILHKR